MITDTSFNIELLYVLVAVNDAHSINKSSDTLRMTQPAISKKIKQLETYYGKQLFLRSAQGMTLTSAGQNLYLETKKLIQQFENMHALMTESQVSLADLKLGSLDSIASNMYPNFFSHYLSDLKEVTLTNKIYELITPFNSGQLDAILIDHEFSKEVTGQFEDIQLFEEPYYLVYSQKNKDLVTLNRPTLDPTRLAMKQLAEPFTRTVSLFTRDKATRQLIHEMLIKS
ncbi:LysR family transcriptional regulator [Leuconostoc rapi]|uniref:LysR family transcriptional regulator n=1 Tax=Leuconostoc rapi TaxID=1406906 RepID=UPI0019583648|nr:LysR family transcriptional regulator [Leuconostoc rapi]MBM7436118.1 DNA-binding transcriptional LysR family regulator [Leuconostoc rapi]